MNPRGILILILASTACGRDATAPDEDFAGRWIVTESGAIVTLDLSCVNSGVLQLDHRAGALAGDYDMRGQCTMHEQATDNPRFGPVTNVTVRGATLRFTHGECKYVGTLGSSDDIMSGDVTCSYPVSGRSYTYKGGWSAMRVPAPQAQESGAVAALRLL